MQELKTTPTYVKASHMQVSKVRTENSWLIKPA